MYMRKEEESVMLSCRCDTCRYVQNRIFDAMDVSKQARVRHEKNDSTHYICCVYCVVFGGHLDLTECEATEIPTIIDPVVLGHFFGSARFNSCGNLRRACIG